MKYYSILAYLVCNGTICPETTITNLNTILRTTTQQLAAISNNQYKCNKLQVKQLRIKTNATGPPFEYYAAQQGALTATHNMFFLPHNPNQSAIGWAQVGGNKSVFNTYCHTSLACLIHELGHNLGLSHASYQNRTYDDTSNAMGSSPNGIKYIGYNAAHLAILGWVKPIYFKRTNFRFNIKSLDDNQAPFTDGGGHYISWNNGTTWNKDAKFQQNLLIHTIDQTSPRKTILSNFLKLNTCTLHPFPICVKNISTIIQVYSPGLDSKPRGLPQDPVILPGYEFCTNYVAGNVSGSS